MAVLRKDKFSYNLVGVVQNEGFGSVRKSKFLGGKIGGNVFGTVDAFRLVILCKNLLAETVNINWKLILKLILKLVLVLQFVNNIGNTFSGEREVFSGTQIQDNAVLHFDSGIVKNFVQTVEHQTVFTA